MKCKRLAAMLCCAVFLFGVACSEGETMPAAAVQENEDEPGSGEGEVWLTGETGEPEEVELAETEEIAPLPELWTVPVQEEDTQSLKYGDVGPEVMELQQKLTKLHYYSGALTGRYHEATQDAVKTLQKDFGLDETGMADAKTQALLFSLEYRPLRYGSIGDDVKRLQTRLAWLGYYKGKISGNYLEETRSAVSSFQKKMGWETTGQADVYTQQVVYSSAALLYDAKEKLRKYETATPVPTVAVTPAPAYRVSEDDGETIETQSTVFVKKLSKGSFGEQVKLVQRRLTDLGYYSGPISGSFQGNTFNAVKAFQKKHWLDVDGVVGEKTWNMLFNDPQVLPASATPRPTPTPPPPAFAITVDVNNQVTTVYGRDENDEYTVVVRQMICSTGTTSNPSDVGDWVLNGATAKWCYFPKWGSHARYWTRINSAIAFHSVIYNSVDTSDLSVKSYKQLGKRASHGCIRLTVSDAKWIYDNVGEGTVVSIVEKMPDDPELKASVAIPALDYSTMLPQVTPRPTMEPVYMSGSTPPLPLATMKKGDSSEAVYHLQRKLTDLGYYSGKCSGTYLAGTQNAVKAFQREHGLNVTGTADVKTLEAIYADELLPLEPVYYYTVEEDEPEPAPTPSVREVQVRVE